MSENKDILSENGISHTGMSLLEVIVAYPEQALELLRKSTKSRGRGIIEQAIEFINEYKRESTKDPSIDPIQQLIAYLQEKVKNTDESKAFRNLKEVPPALDDPNLEHKTDYEIAKRCVSILPGISLGQEINTPIGKGIVIKLSMPSNGLYLSPEQAEVVVWYSTMGSKSGWVQSSYNYPELVDYL